jgi:hypothetical protein
VQVYGGVGGKVDKVEVGYDAVGWGRVDEFVGD